MLKNPYLNRSMIRSVGQFYGRRRELERIMARLGAATPQSVSVVGQRRIGKSSLLWHLSQSEVHARYLPDPEQQIFLLLDFQGQQHLDREGFCRGFCRALQQAADGRAPLAEAADLSGLERTVSALGRSGLRLVCLFDEFETVTRSPAFGPEFFGFLRSLANSLPVAFVTSSRRELQSLCHTREISESPFFNIFSPVRLGPLLESEARGLIAVPSTTAGIPLASWTEELLALGGRLPFFLQLACSAAFECSAEKGIETIAWNQVEARFREEADVHFQYIWDRLEEPERQAVAELAAGGPVASEHAPLLGRLASEGFLVREPTGDRLCCRGFSDFVRELRPLDAPSAPAIAVPAMSCSLVALKAGEHPFPRLVGQSLALRRALALVQRAVPTEVTVLLSGETGTGKELVARTIHEQGPRAAQPFVVVNCGAIPEHLQESELFGHRRGAFTGAVTDREGLFEAASGGTLFLDEVADTSLPTQVKLLRALQEGEIRRVGENQIRQVDVRLVCATNRDLAQEVRAGRFREDLYYRLYVLVIELPPLRQRPEDIPLLVEHLLAGYPEGIESQALTRLLAYAWPGNIRELENQLASAVALAGGGKVGVEHLWPRIQIASGGAAMTQATTGTPPFTRLPVGALEHLTLKEARIELECHLIRERLARHRGNLDAAAQDLGVSRSRLYELIRQYGLALATAEPAAKRKPGQEMDDLPARLD